MKKLLLLAGVFASTLGYTQNFKCGVTPEIWKQELQKAKPSTSRSGNLKTQAAIKYIPLTIYFVRHTNGSYSTNTSITPFYESLMMTNRMLNDIGIQFYVDGAINYLDNDNYLKPTRGDANHIALKANKNPNTVNVWINDGWAGDASSGYGGPGGIELQDITLTTVPHEFGHFLTLAHTFDFGNGIENVARTGAGSNCSTAGDGICDTEADPFGLKLASNQILGADQTNSNCQLTSDTRDLSGATYNPPYDNCMSYYGGSCAMLFTPGQYTKMTNGYNTYHTGYGTMTGAGIAAAPTNLVVVEHVGYADIHWQNAANAVATVIEVSSDNGTNWKVLAGELSANTETTLHDLKKGTTYLFRARHLNGLTYSATVSYTSNLNYPFIPIHFNHNSTSVAVNGIASFNIANTSINNVSNANNDYTLTSPSTDAKLIRGGNYPFTVTKQGSSFAYFVVWVDENADGTFNGTNELKYHSGVSSSTNIAISETADTGFVRLRVRCFYNASTANPTSTNIWSETEDYVIKIVNGQQTVSYCTPVTSNPCNGGGYGIYSFQIPSANLNYTVTSPCGVNSVNGYTDESQTVIGLSAGTSYPFTASNGGGYTGLKNVNLYIDFNHNGDFETSELVYTTTSATTDPLSASFAVPSNATNGYTRLRIRAYFNPIADACASASIGETYDYGILITGGKEEKVNNLIISNTTMNALTLSWSISANANPTGYTIKQSADGQNYTTIGTAASNDRSYTATGLSTDTRYYFQVIANGTLSSDARTIYGSTASLSTAIANANATEALQAFPNPTQHELFVVGSMAQQESLLLVKNTLGQPVDCDITRDGQGWKVKTSNLEKGIYLVVVQSDTNSAVIRFMKE